ncbi:MAG: hypothetical protein KIS92_12115 [Planctomycetota bacterium]|nr:hypothetical protein [Planctomycetota bacterium]
MPARRYATRHNAADRFHCFSINSFHWRPLLISNLRKAWLASAMNHACAEHQVRLEAYSMVPWGIMVLVRPKRIETDLRLWADDVKGRFTERWMETRPLKRRVEHRSFHIHTPGGSKEFRLWQPFLNRYAYADSRRCIDRLIDKCHAESSSVERSGIWTSVHWQRYSEDWTRASLDGNDRDLAVKRRTGRTA